jgi:plasmid maintenance system antidote protein VapI
LPDDRYRLHDGELLRRLMKRPLEGGTVHTVRSLADATGLSYSKIQKLIKEERPDVDAPEADRIAEAVQSRRRALFSPTSFTFKNENEGKHPRGPR